ncbi:MAG: hypothetical protein QOG07_609, partial [Pseudonocardiales bacterium]|nr:hypothetical protein [Pseudonocardiales bacterium]
MARNDNRSDNTVGDDADESAAALTTNR